MRPRTTSSGLPREAEAVLPARCNRAYCGRRSSSRACSMLPIAVDRQHAAREHPAARHRPGQGPRGHASRLVPGTRASRSLKMSCGESAQVEARVVAGWRCGGSPDSSIRAWSYSRPNEAAAYQHPRSWAGRRLSPGMSLITGPGRMSFGHHVRGSGEELVPRCATTGRPCAAQISQAGAGRRVGGAEPAVLGWTSMAIVPSRIWRASSAATG